MACSALFLLILFAASKATPISSYICNLNAKFSASGNGTDTTDLSEAASSLQYCLIDNCTRGGSRLSSEASGRWSKSKYFIRTVKILIVTQIERSNI